MKVNEIKQLLKNASIEQIDDLLQVYQNDSRSGVQKLIAKYKRKQEALKNEKIRIEKMKEFEYKYQDSPFICGIDEVGRGPLCGPVVACGVILPKDTNLLYINDSKKVSAKMRDILYPQIMKEAVAVGIGVVSPQVIDEINILNATYEAMRIAINKMETVPTLLLNDAVHIPGIDIQQVSLIKGDSRSISIAAASIVAKVTRDRMMEEYDKLYPGYGFAKNKGYGSKEHIEALKKLGACPIHRNSFIHHFITV